MTVRLRWRMWLAGGALVALALPAPGATPVLRLESIIGEARGRALDSVHVTVSDTGSIYLLMRNGRIAVFNREGAYQQSSVAGGLLRDRVPPRAEERPFSGDYRSVNFRGLRRPAAMGRRQGLRKSRRDGWHDGRTRLCVDRGQYRRSLRPGAN